MKKPAIESAEGSEDLLRRQIKCWFESQKGSFRSLLDKLRVSLRADEKGEKWSHGETFGRIRTRVRGVNAELSFGNCFGKAAGRVGGEVLHQPLIKQVKGS